MGFRKLLLTTLALAPALGLGQAAARIEFDTPRHFLTFTSEKPPTSLPKGEEHQGPLADIQLAPEGSLYVWDRDSGNMARKPAAEVGKLWRVTPRELALIGQVIVHVEHQGEPVAAARVVLKDATGERSQLLDSTAGGEAQFFAVKPGKVTVSVEYRSGGGEAPPVTQIFDLPLQRNSPDPLLKIALSEPVQTIEPRSAASETPTPPARRVAKRNFLGSLLIYLIGLAAAGALGYYAYRMAMKNPKWMQSQLGRFGVTTQGAQPAPDPVDARDPIPDPVPITPPAPAKIILDDPAPSSSPVAPSEPRLVRTTGEAVSLPEGEAVVGREPGLAVSLAGESSISRRHAAVIRQGSSLVVRDLGSTNGTFVNGRKIDADTPLRSGDDVQFGAVRFRVEGA